MGRFLVFLTFLSLGLVTLPAGGLPQEARPRVGEREPCVMFERRTPDVVRILGRDLPQFLGCEIPLIRLMAYRVGRWVFIPFQIDEKDDEGAFLFPYGRENDRDKIDNRLDRQDEIVFMAGDVGCQHPPSAWPSGCAAGQEIEVADPLTGERGWCYFCSFSKPPPSSLVDLIDYDPDYDMVSSAHYIVSYSRVKGKQNAVMESYVVPEEDGGNGVNFLDSAKAWIHISFLFSLVKMNLHSDGFLSSVPAYIDGPIRVIIKKRTAIRLGLGLHSPEVDADLIYYPHFFNSALVIAIPFDPSLVTSHLYMTIGTDLNHHALGMLFWNSCNPEPVIVDGLMSPQEESMDLSPDRWRVLSGAQGKYLAKAVYAGNFKLSNIKLNEGRYIDDLSHRDPPENEPGIYGSYRWTWDITNGKTGKYVVWIEAHYGARIEKPEDVMDCMNVTDHPLHVRTGAKEILNCLLIPPPGFTEGILPEMYLTHADPN